jgi:hypothetical protein
MHGLSQVLVLRGEAGVGKTALIDYIANTSSDCHVVRVSGVESEMELPFAGVHQLCAPMLDGVTDLPGPQRDALCVAFGLEIGEAADRFLVGLAVLSLLSAAAEQRPLVCLIDDAQWLDEVSAQILGFVARRLQAESIALVFAVRDPSDVRVLDWTAAADHRRLDPRRCPRAAGSGQSPTGRWSAGADHRRDPRQPARPARAASRLERRRTGGRVRAPGDGPLAGQIEQKLGAVASQLGP